MPEIAKVLMVNEENQGILARVQNVPETERPETLGFPEWLVKGEDDDWDSWRQGTEEHVQMLENALVEHSEKIENGNMAMAQLAESYKLLLGKSDSMMQTLQTYLAQENTLKSQMQNLKDEVAGQVFCQVSQKFQAELYNTTLPEFAQALKKEISETLDAKLKSVLGNVQEQTLQVSTNAVQNLQVLTPQIEALHGGMASTDRRVQLQEEKMDFIAKVVDNLNLKLDQLEKIMKGQFQGEFEKFSAYWSCTMMEIKADVQKCHEASQKKNLDLEALDLEARLANLCESVGRKFAELTLELVLHDFFQLVQFHIQIVQHF
jgi:hypothetical protein